MIGACSSRAGRDHLVSKRFQVQVVERCYSTSQGIMLLLSTRSFTERALIPVRHAGVGKGKTLMAKVVSVAARGKHATYKQADHASGLSPIYPPITIPPVKPAKGSTKASPNSQTERPPTLHGCTTPLGTVSANAPHFSHVLFASSPRKTHHGGLDLRPEIRTMECTLVHKPGRVLMLLDSWQPSALLALVPATSGATGAEIIPV